MRINSVSRLLALLLPMGLVLPAWAEDAPEEVTDELPDWMESELEDVRAWQLQVEGSAQYGADIPSPEEVVYRGAPAAPAAAQPPVTRQPEPEDLTFDDFREGLAPYGSWVHTPEYGRVFVPARTIQVEGWRPYLHGQWVWTSYGWTWVSDEPFGWATYHYGRWGFRAGLGWFWVPGYTWGPAWVAWRHGPDSIGWAPLYPGYVRVTASYPIHVDHWIFVGHTHFHGHPVHRHWHRHHHHHHFHRSHWAKHWRHSGRVYAGPPRTWVERRVGRVHEVKIVHARRPAPSRVVAVEGSRRVEIYRPSARGAVRPVTKRPAPSAVRAARPTAGSGLSGRPPAVRERRETPVRRGADKRVTAPSRSGSSERRKEGSVSTPRPSMGRDAVRRDARPNEPRRSERRSSPSAPARRPTESRPGATAPRGGSSVVERSRLVPSTRQTPPATMRRDVAAPSVRQPKAAPAPQRSFSSPSPGRSARVGSPSGGRSSPSRAPSSVRAPSRSASKAASSSSVRAPSRASKASAPSRVNTRR